MAAPALRARLARERYLLVTTFRRTGHPVPTPVWFVLDGQTILVWTGATTGKVRRIRANPTVQVAACTARGLPTSDPLTAHAAILSAPPPNAKRLFVAKYGMQYRALRAVSRVRAWLTRRPPAPVAYLAITLETA
jgi:PPOX class probable F420-dependent enzyme